MTPSYLLESWKLLFQPWHWKKGYGREKLRSTLQYWFDAKCYLFSSGREGLLGLFRSLDFETSSEILIQGYTCVALPNAIHAAGYTSVYIDIDPNTLNMHIGSIENKITPRTKAIICQHTFGIPADTQALREICDKHHLVLIEDMAHIIPDVSGPDNLGKDADMIMLSFGRDKAISGICGGAIICRNDHVCEELEEEEKRAKEMSSLHIFRLLLYPTIYAVAKLLFAVILGKYLLYAARACGLFVPVLTQSEKQGKQSPLLKRMPNSCAILAGKEMKNMHSINNHRRKRVRQFIEATHTSGWDIPSAISENLPLQKFPLLVEDPDTLRSRLKKHNVFLDDGWTGAAVCPRSVHLESTGYTLGSCPNAEEVAKSIVTLPTHITMTEAASKAIINYVNS